MQVLTAGVEHDMSRWLLYASLKVNSLLVSIFLLFNYRENNKSKNLMEVLNTKLPEEFNVDGESLQGEKYEHLLPQLSCVFCSIVCVMQNSGRY